MAGLHGSVDRAQMAGITEPFRRMSLVSAKSSRGASRKESSTTSSTTASNTTDNSSNSSRPSITGSNRRRSSLASFSSLLKKSRRQTLTVSEEDDTPHTEQGQSVGERFLHLPAEIHTIILAYLSVPELLSFRQVSRSCLNTIQANSTAIARNVLRLHQSEDKEYAECDSDFLIHLYPSTFSSTTTDAYLLRTLRRRVLLKRQLKVLLTFIQTRVYMLKLTRQLECEHFAPYRPGLRISLYRTLGYVQHLTESIRHLILYSHPSHPSPSIPINDCPTCTSLHNSVISSYPSHLLVPMYQVLQLLSQHTRTATRSPSSVTAFERKLRGWSYGPPPEEHISQLILLGGFTELCKIDEMQGSYSRRLAVVKSYADILSEATRINNIAFPDIYKTTSDPVMAPPPSSRMQKSTSYNNKRYGNGQSGDQNLHTAIEAYADTQPLTLSLNCNLNILTPTILSTIPYLDRILVGPDAPLGVYIKKHRLMYNVRDYASPYAWLTGLLEQVYEPENGSGNGRTAEEENVRRDSESDRYRTEATDYGD